MHSLSIICSHLGRIISSDDSRVRNQSFDNYSIGEDGESLHRDDFAPTS